MDLTRGSLSEQPWGLTLGALAQRSATGELTIAEGAMRIVLAFETGRLVAATSSMRASSLLERAARTFELTRGSYTIADALTLRPERSGSVDLRAVVFAGARKYLPDDRLGMELREFGSRYMLASATPEELARFGLEASAAIVEALREGATLAELEARHHEVDGRELRAALYALVCCGAARGLLPARAPSAPGAGRTPTPPGSRTTTPQTSRTTTPGSTPPASRTTTPSSSRTTTPGSTPPASRTTTPSSSRTTTPGSTPPASRTTTPASSRAPTPIGDRTPTRPDRPRAQPDSSRTITPNTAVRSDATPVPIARIPTANVARSNTTPDTARTKTPPDPARTKSQPEAARARTREHAPDASTVLDPTSMMDAATDRGRSPRQPSGTPATIGRTPTRTTPAGGVPMVSPAARVTPAGGVAIIGGPPPRITPAGGIPIASGVRAEADAAAQRARTHLAGNAPDRAVQETAVAVKLAPDNFDHQALHAWATFLVARDRTAAAEPARKVLEKASHRATAPNEARFLLGRLERMVGREREALRHFKAVLEREPGHAAAATELRELEAELEAFARR